MNTHYSPSPLGRWDATVYRAERLCLAAIILLTNMIVTLLCSQRCCCDSCAQCVWLRPLELHTSCINKCTCCRMSGGPCLCRHGADYPAVLSKLTQRRGARQVRHQRDTRGRHQREAPEGGAGGLLDHIACHHQRSAADLQACHIHAYLITIHLCLASTKMLVLKS